MKYDSKLILPGWPDYGEEEIEAVTEVLHRAQGNYWFGEQGRKFEREFAEYCGSAFALTVGNGTLALQLALHALNIGEGDEVIVTPRSFVASANCIVLSGATPIFVDVDPDSQNITVATIEAGITSKTRAIIVVHLAGWPCDMDEIMALAGDYNIFVIEDCAQAHGAAINGRKVGGLGHVSAFSFCHDKIISAGGEGGIVLTNDEEIWARAASFRNHGKDPRKYDLNIFDSKNIGLADTFGSNYRLTEMQSAICRIQLTQLDNWVALRRRNAHYLTEALVDYDAVRLTIPPDNIYHAYYKYYFFLNISKLGKAWNQKRIIADINNSGIPCSTGSSAELYMHEAFVKEGFCPPGPLPIARKLGETSVMLPVNPNLTEEHLKDMCGAISHVLECASGK